MDIGVRTEKLIKLLKLSKVEAMREMKISKQSLYNIINGATKYPSVEAFINLKMLHPEINLNWVFMGIGDPLISGKDREVSVRSLATLDPETLVTRIQAAEDLVGILKDQLTDKEKVIKLLEKLSSEQDE